MKSTAASTLARGRVEAKHSRDLMRSNLDRIIRRVPTRRLTAAIRHLHARTLSQAEAIPLHRAATRPRHGPTLRRRGRIRRQAAVTAAGADGHQAVAVRVSAAEAVTLIAKASQPVSQQ